MATMAIHEQIACIKHEITMRYRVYPALVRKGTMTQADMDRELACMQAVLETLQRLTQPRLFDDEKMSTAIAAQHEALQKIDRLLGGQP